MRKGGQRRSRAGCRLENDDRDRHAGEASGDEGTHRTPVEAAQAAADGRDGDGPDAVAGEGRGEVAKPGLDVADRAAVAPVTLGGKMHDPPGPVATGGEHEHAARPHAAAFACAAVGEEGVGVAALELEGESASHDADAVGAVERRRRGRGCGCRSVPLRQNAGWASLCVAGMDFCSIGIFNFSPGPLIGSVLPLAKAASPAGWQDIGDQASAPMRHAAAPAECGASVPGARD